MILWAGFAIGLMGSLHCVGMCGPLAFAVPISEKGIWSRWASVLAYQIGRAVVYALLGAVSGLVGRHFFLLGFQRHLSLLMGTVMLLSVAVKFVPSGWRSPIGGRTSVLEKLTVPLHKAIMAFWGKGGIGSVFMVGMLNGLLPCGMVYFALAAALSLPGGVFTDTLFMALFGFGTLPLMAAVHFFGLGPSARTFRNHFNRASPYFAFAVGAIIFLRGLSLGIPYLSPYIGSSAGGAVSCH